MANDTENISSTTPAAPSAPASPRRKRWPLFAGILFLALIFFGSVGFVVASALEEHDSFCTSCHTVPETTYYNRAYLALDNPTLAVNDLATAHYHLAQDGKKEPFACINCHRGDSSLGHRISTIALAGRDTITYVTGNENPQIEKTNIRESWLPNAACVSCHTPLLMTVSGLNNHFHTLLPQAGEAQKKGGKLIAEGVIKGNDAALAQWSHTVSDVNLTCTSCHLAHTTIQNGKATFYMQPAQRNEACITCHKVAGKGPQDAKTLGN
jgi:hypothetical protein